MGATKKNGALRAKLGSKPELTKEEAELRKASAQLLLSPSLKAAQIARKTVHYALCHKDESESSFTADIVVAIDEARKKVKDGDMGFLEGMLVAQACALDSLFCKLAVMGTDQTDRNNLQVVVGLALRAQNGCRATIETLGALKNPQGFTVVKQVNAAGVQQVNNGPVLAHATPEAFPQNKVLEVMPHEPKRLDAGATGADAGLDSLVGTVAALDRPPHARGKSPRCPQRVEGRKARRAAGRAAALPRA